MKILHTADLHLGAPMRAHLPPREAKLRREELLSAFHRLLELARSEKCAAVLISGDLFDSEAAAAMLAPAVLGAIEKYREMDFYYVCGNHEKEDWLKRSVPKNLHIFGDDFSYFPKENVVFFGKSFPKSTDFANIHLQTNKVNILILHGAWDRGEAKSADIPLGLLRGRGIDYCALGHYHTYGEIPIDERGVAVYAGCPEGRGFDETGKKGVVLIEVHKDRLSHRFIPLEGRTLHRFQADISEAKSLVDIFSICEKVIFSAAEKDLVRLILTGKRAHCPAPDTEAIKRHFSHRFYYLEVADASVPAPDIAAIRAEQSLRGEFVRTVLREDHLNDEERMRILSLGLAALSGDMEGGALWS